ncbi:mitochondrial inner membrane protein OXA1L [Nematolebias whitei]|uniref:mitochondrial inner membrane protein OXA1L n=1 Tax=Nematolebias whitei TaxID=451745 RepID=UPI00189815A5|nr:mitochondrial inner membrane protein OXA1L [Nematolebias whitei]
MAAISRGVTPSCIARCFLRQTGKPSRGSHSLQDTRNQLLLQRSHLHMLFRCSRPSSSRHHGKLVWVNAVVVRHSSSQIPPDEGSAAPPEVVVLSSPPVLESSSMSQPADGTPAITQTVPEQMTAEMVSMTTSAAENLTLPPSDPAPALTPPLVEQVVDAAPTAADVLQAVAAEPLLVELGLGGYTPVGLIQNLLEFFHLGLGLPWWGAIVTGTVLARLVMFPIIVKGQREAAKLNNVLPQVTKLTNKMNEAKQSGNKYEFAKAFSDLNLFQKKHDVNPLRSFLVPLVQAPVFFSFFVALRKMAYLPVPSLQTGGALWFMDLTAADPFYLLPLAVTGTMFLILELGAESGVNNPNLQAMKTVFRIMPLAILPLTINFPTAVFTYWMTSNCFSLFQVVLLKNLFIRNKLGIPNMIKHPDSDVPKTEGLIKGMKKGWKNAQLAQQLEERERRVKKCLDIAAKGPLRQTFTHNPLKQTSSAKPKEVGVKAKLWKDTIG